MAPSEPGSRKSSANNFPEHLLQCALICLGKPPQVSYKQRLFGSKQHRLNDGWLDQPRRFPVLYQNLSESEGRTDPASDGSQNDIGFLAIVGSLADHNGRSALAIRLIGEGELDQDNVAEAIAHRKLRPRRCPTPA
jgi:hypothetical protein